MPFVTKADAAQLGSEPVSITPYISAEYFALEREKIFLKTWLFAARVEELPDVGDFFVKDFDVCGACVLLTKAKDGNIRAFHNVCTHRLAKLVWEERGNAHGLTCRYHGWGFALNGQLRIVPDIEGFYDLNKASCELTRIHLDIWNGFIFINLAERPEQTLAEFLSPIVPKLNEHSFEGFTSVAVLSAEVDVNWKPMLDNFQETYHLLSLA